MIAVTTANGFQRGKLRVWRVLGFCLLGILGAAVAGYAVATRLFGALADGDAQPPLGTMIEWPGVLTWHAVAGAGALLTGLAQLWPFGRGVTKRWHQKIGWVYVCAVTVSGVAGLWLAPWAEGGRLAKTGFGLLAAVWLATTGAGVWSAVTHDFGSHRRLMAWSVALTCAGITLRVQLAVCEALGEEFAVVYPWIAWTSWVPNLIFAEACLRRK